ncbi:hypothetical protein IFR05_001070 [Cadophora sp. M221]|nr:hypothetical protein IFR05_001070 [Cadophora sp. M221]
MNSNMQEQANIPSSEDTMAQEIAKLKSELKVSEEANNCMYNHLQGAMKCILSLRDDQRLENEKSISLATEKAAEISYLHQLARADRKIYENRIEELKQSIEEKPHQHSALGLRSELDMSKREVSDLLSARKSLEGRLKHEEQANQALHLEVQMTEDQFAVAAEQNSSHEVAIKELRSELEATKGEMDKLQSLSQELEYELEHEQKTSRTLSSKLEAANHHIGLLSEQKIDDIVKIQKLRSELATKSDVLSANDQEKTDVAAQTLVPMKKDCSTTITKLEESRLRKFRRMQQRFRDLKLRRAERAA